MTTGRELDALVAEKVMGLKAHPKWANEGTLFNGDQAEPYSADIAAAWEVVEKMRMGVFPGFGGKWCAALEPENNVDAGDLEYWRFYTEAATAPLAICLAALKAVESK